MLAGVEGRTPFADARLAVLCAGLPMRDRYDARAAERDPGAPWTTKRALRGAFRDVLPAEVVERPKASFPLPFVEWCGSHAGALKTSGVVREWFTPAAIELVASRPSELWRLAWPMINLALWGRRFA
jgi:asparagine synthase (glutamine-hydrolysing)